MMVRVLVLAALALTGCASSTLAPTGPFTRELTVAPGSSTSVVEGVSVVFRGVAGDSRCPGDAICIQGGDAVVQLQISAGGGQSDVDLHTGSLQPVTARALTLELLELTPYPFSSRPIAPADYRAKIRISR
jgi:hypothetical protein